MPALKNENYPIKTVGEDAFYSNYIGPIITLFQNLNKSPKIQKLSDGQNKHKPGEWYHTWCLYEISKLSD